MRSLPLLFGTLAAVLSMTAADARAAIIVDFQVGGSSSISAAASSTVTIDVYVTATGTTSIAGYQFAITYDSDITAGSGANLTNYAPALSWTCGGAGVSLGTGTGYAAAISCSTLTTPADDITASDGMVLIGSIELHVGSPATDGIDVSGCFNCTSQGYTGDGAVGSGDLSVTWNGLSIDAIPEPTTATLLGLGLLGLAAASRSRKEIRGP